MTIRLEDAIKNGWKLESEGNLAGIGKHGSALMENTWQLFGLALTPQK